MAPAVVEAAVAGSAAKEFKKESGTARLLGSGMLIRSSYKTRLIGSGSAGIAELAIFHPVRRRTNPWKTIFMLFPGGHHSEAIDEQSGKGKTLPYYIRSHISNS